MDKKYKGSTPRPWFVAEHMYWEPDRTIQYELAIVDCGDGESLHIHEAPSGGPSDKRGQNEANAILIADAPMLAEQNEKMLAMLKVVGDAGMSVVIPESLFDEASDLVAEIERGSNE